MCEAHECVIAAENEWRLENCESYDYEPLGCNNPFVCVECEGAWTCEDIAYYTM